VSSSSSFCRGSFLAVGALQEPIQTCAPDAEHLSCADAVAIAHLKNALDMDAADFIERQRTPGTVCGQGASPRPLHVLRQIVHIDKFGIGGDSGAGHHVFQLANAARPVVLQQSDVRAPSEALKRFAVGLAVVRRIPRKGLAMSPLGKLGPPPRGRIRRTNKTLSKRTAERRTIVLPSASLPSSMAFSTRKFPCRPIQKLRRASCSSWPLPRSFVVNQSLRHTIVLPPERCFAERKPMPHAVFYSHGRV
jgi:hypothetical protein